MGELAVLGVMNPMEEKDIIKELELLDHVASRRKKENGIEYYVPNAHQLKAHKSKARFVLLCGANRIGKSTFGAVELTWHLTRKYPAWYPYERRFRKPIKAAVVCLENPIVQKVIEPKIREYLPLGYVLNKGGFRYVTGGYLSRITCIDGSTVDFLTNEQDDMAFEGSDYDFFWGDEPQRERKFEAIQRGLIDRRGRGVITFTPLVEPWMKERLVDRADGVNIEVITATMRDNLCDIEGNPILAEKDIQDFEDNMPEDVKQTRVYGKFFHLKGLVWPEFSDIHIHEFNYTYPDPVISIMDPHDRQPHHIIWAVIDRTNDILIHSELSIRANVRDLCLAILAHEKNYSYKIRKRIIDPNFGRSPLITTGRNMIEELYHSGCGGWTEADDAKAEGRLKVKDYLAYNPKFPVSHTNKPKLYFHRYNCPLTIRSVRNHQYEEWVGKISGEKDPKEKSKDKETHGADCIRYLCMSNPSFESQGAEDYEPEAAYY